MNILISSGHYYLSDKSGSEPIWGIEIARQYVNLGHMVYMVAGVADLNTPINGVQLYSFKKSRSSSVLSESLMRFIYPFYSFIVSLWISTKLNKNIDLVHHVAPVSTMSYDLFFIGRFLPKAKYIIGPGLITPDINDATAFSHGSGVVHTKKSVIIHRMIKIVLPIFGHLFRSTLQGADFVIAGTPESQEFYSKFTDPKKVVQIPIGINIDDKKTNIQNKNNKNLVIVSVSNLIERKGVDLIIRAFAILKSNNSNIVLNIVGNGPEMIKLKQLTHDLKIEKSVNFIGFVNHAEVDKYYSKSDIFCSATRHEPYGMTLLEAMSYSLPVVCSHVNSTSYIVGNGGLMFIKDDINDLHKKLNIFVSSKKIRLQYGVAGKKRVSTMFTWGMVVDKYLNLINNP